MFIRAVRKESLTVSRTTLGLLGVCLLLLWYPAAVSTGISRGLSVCTTVIIPTLYPFMLLAGILTESPMCRRPGRLSGWIARRLFGLPGCCTPAILMSLTGGYPAGILAVARLYRQGQITRQEMRRMTAYCVGGGPGFIISTVGGMLLGSVQAGVWLYGAQVAATLLIGTVLGRGHRHRPKAADQPPETPPRPFANTVSDTCAALLTMCGFVVLGAMVLSLTEAAGASAAIAAAL
ncbi:MAG: hypothetical protein IKU51_04080, partial [Clostridia bacterium]|nr:hypothetical protein [Clostridia bacterium]